MKKVIFSALALLGALTSQGQAPVVADVQHSDKAAAMPHRSKIKVKANDDQAVPGNHGQTVSTVAHTTTLTGADKGAAVSAAARGERTRVHTARGGRGHSGAHAGGGRGRTRQGGAGGHGRR